MEMERTNLLPPASLRSFRRGYIFRVATVMLVAITLLVVIHGILLIPTYLYVRAEARVQETELSRLTERLAAVEEQAVSERLTLLEQAAAHLSRLEKTSSGSALLRAILTIKRNGIRISNIAFSPPTDGTEGRMTIQGAATTRDALQEYVRELEALPYVTSANLPINAYTKESDIVFTVTLMGSLAP